VSKHSICSNSLSRNALSLDRAVDKTEAIACSAVFDALLVRVKYNQKNM
jgi:hypothetical protein